MKILIIILMSFFSFSAFAGSKCDFNAVEASLVKNFGVGPSADLLLLPIKPKSR